MGSDIAGTERAPMVRRVADASLRHPVATVFVVALSTRVVVAVAVFVVFGGALFYDDATYSSLAAAKAAGEGASWSREWRDLYRATAAFLVPLTGVYSFLGPVVLAGQLMVASVGALTAALTTRLALEVVPRTWAVAAGLVVAWLPSQVLWSSLTLKDAFVWAALVALALVVALAARARAGRLLALGLLAAALLLLLARLRMHTMVIGAWSAAAASWVGGGRRVLRGIGAIALACIVPALVGGGPGGLEVVLEGDTPAQRRVANAVGAETAFVPIPPTTTTVIPANVPPPPAPAGSTGLGTELRHLVRGISVMLLEPYPWDPVRSDRLRFAKAENLVWYPVLGVACAGFAALVRHRRVLLFPTLAAAGILVTYALAEGNFGTAYRHRGELVWVVAVAAGAGGARLGAKRAPRALAGAVPCETESNAAGSSFPGGYVVSGVRGAMAREYDR